MHEVGEDAAGFGIEIRVEVHSEITQEPKNFSRILEYADRPNVVACWNSNPTDVVSGSVQQAFTLIASNIRSVHLHDLNDASYSYRELFALLSAQHYEGFTLAEIPSSGDPERMLRYFKALWQAHRPSSKQP